MDSSSISNYFKAKTSSKIQQSFKELSEVILERFELDSTYSLPNSNLNATVSGIAKNDINDSFPMTPFSSMAVVSR